MNLRLLPEKYRNKRSYLSWLGSYSLFLFLFLLSITLITVWAKAILKEEIVNANKASFDTIQSNIDSVKADLDKLAVAIASSEPVLRFVQKTGENTYEDYYNINLMKSQFQSYWKTYDYVSEIAVFQFTSEELIINGGLLDGQDAYQDYALVEGQSYEDWLGFIKENHKQELYRGKNGLIFYMQSIPYSIYEKPKGTMLLTIDKWKFSRLLQEDNFKKGKSFLLLNHKDEIIFEQGAQAFAEGGNPLSGETLRHTEQIDSGLRGKLRCMMLISDRVFWKSVNKMYWIVLLATVALLCAGVLLAFRFANKHYSPVKAMLKLMGQQPGENSGGDEYDLIRGYFTDTLASLKQSQRLQRQYKNEMLSSEVVRFLNHRLPADSLSELFHRFQTEFSFPAYYGVLISVIDVSDSFSGGEIDIREEQDVIRLAITNILEETAGAGTCILSFSLSETVIFCLAGMGEEDTAGWKKGLVQAQRLTREKAGIYYTAALSAGYHTLDDTAQAYLQTIDVQAFGKNTSQDVLFYEEINWGGASYVFTPDMERRLTALISAGKEEEACLLIAQLCAMGAPELDILQRLSWLKYDVTGVCLKLLRQGRLEMEPEAARLLSQAGRCGTLEEFRECAFGLVRLLCNRSEHKQNAVEQRPLAEQIIEEVQAHYADLDLNVNMLGQKYGLTPGYLSKLFKDHTGQMLRSYIMSVRLKNAQILLSTELKLDAVAQQCGFADSGSFIRAFKKQFGVTPGKYREAMRSSQQEQ